MSKQHLFAKSTSAAVAEAETGEELLGEFTESMKELDAFVKANAESAPIVSKRKQFVKEEEDEDDQAGEKPHDEDESDVMGKAQERNLEMNTNGQTSKKKIVHAKTMAKSVETDEDDSSQTYDGEKVIAGFQESLNKVAKSVSMMMRRMDEMQAENASLTVMLAKAIKIEGTLIKAVAGEISQIGNTGRPRKSTLAIFEKSASGSVTKDERPAFDGADFLNKAVAASAAGRISPVQVGEIRQMLTMNQSLPEQLVKQVEGK
ncbi:MAG: hypothetical protein Q7U76_13035 [Nitrospirota bacterium]|nr:hypothetical protein [Nitrospirota bacterium]